MAYIFCITDELVYIGQGWNCVLRVAEHTRKDSDKVFTHWSFFPVENESERKDFRAPVSVLSTNPNPTACSFASSGAARPANSSFKVTASPPLNSSVRPFMEETRATEGKSRALETRLAAALKDTPLTLLSAPENGAASGMALLSCGAGHQFQRAASSILKWRSDRCPFCYSANAKARQAEKLPDPNNLSWLPEGIRLGKGTKPRDLRDQRFGALVARRAIGKHSSGSVFLGVRV